jgi:hypothetical protein
MKKKLPLLEWLGFKRAPTLNLDAFSSSQVGSKIWLVQTLEECLLSFSQQPDKGYRIWILAGWYGVTNLIMRSRAVIPIEHVHSVDLDPDVGYFADKVNKFWEWQAWQFKAHTADANRLSYAVEHRPHVVINSSVEHFESTEWFERIPKGTLVVLQACDLPHDTHVAEYKSIDDLKNKFAVTEEVYTGKMEFVYPERTLTRFMMIGVK